MAAKKNTGKFIFTGVLLTFLFACSWTSPTAPPAANERPSTNTPTAAEFKESTPTATIDSNSQVLEELEFLPEATVATPPTETPVAPLEPISFSESDSDGDSSDDVFYSELLYLAQANINTPFLCNPEEPVPHLSPANEFEPSQKIKIQYETTIQSCWQPNETVLATVIGPDGSIYSQQKFETTDYNQFGLLAFPFKSDVLQNPTGIYRITFEGASGIVETKLVIVPPSEPELYWQEDGTIFFNSFQPNEKVQLFIYTPFPEIDGAKLYAHTGFQTNRDGQLIVSPSFQVPLIWVGAIGDQSGLVEPEFETSSFADMKALRNGISWPTSDTGVEACHLLGETGLQASSTGGDRVTITAEVGVFDFSGNQTATLRPGDIVEVVFGVFWQEIRDRPGEFGWHWSAILPDTGQRASIWDGYFAECA
ncbi:MAG: hypothetical protein AB8G95_16150 [Anaerolineae bacterium]